LIFFPFSSFSSDASFLQAPRRPYFSRSVSTNTIIVERSEEEEEEDEDVIVLVEEDEDDDDVSRSLSISISFLFFGSFLQLGHSLVLTIVFSGISFDCLLPLRHLDPHSIPSSLSLELKGPSQPNDASWNRTKTRTRRTRKPMRDPWLSSGRDSGGRSRRLELSR